MKKSVFGFLIIMLILGTSCSRQYINIDVMRPADVTVPQRVKTIAIVNHAAPKSKWWDIVEGILTGEMIEQDKKGKIEALQGLSQRITQGTRYKIINTTEVLESKGNITGKTFPDALTWTQVDALCRKYHADVILALEHYDSDFIVTNATKQVTNDDGEMETRYIAQGTATVDLGFRLYDARDKSILDQESYSHNRVWEAEGTSATDAALHLISNAQGVYNVSADAGALYAERITPLFVTVNRNYYKKAKATYLIETGARQAQVNDWANAEKSWKDALKATSDSKTSGKAAYNLALCAEMNGDLEGALDWAQKSYTRYGNKKAKQYAQILQGRINDEALLKKQMGN